MGLFGNFDSPLFLFLSACDGLMGCPLKTLTNEFVSGTGTGSY